MAQTVADGPDDIFATRGGLGPGRLEDR
jgi:hypothetical protein